MLELEMKILERVRHNYRQWHPDGGFMSGKSTVDAVFAMRQLVEKYGSVEKDLFVA